MPSFTNRKGRLTASRIFTVDFEIIPPAGICCTAMWGRGRGARHCVLESLTAALVAVAILAPATAMAGDRTNIPLKNWGGFAEFRDAVYDDLERLVTAGLADRVLLNTRPLRSEERRVGKEGRWRGGAGEWRRRGERSGSGSRAGGWSVGGDDRS